ncbi:DNA translocase FtsK [Ureibacillus sinduriensis]|uniref:FtsK domain-containing protein n=1 Tax=Ureibacillus sinduriensis BLB-1 = JCM 15800 TaxID=1384057 RepID=A0A0A3I4R2_9BACL|nr:DNA translocase FtsK [Ureibacillus sinduriensis]KGR77668.1 hypothetical protein CD33_02295 [Ureibacillus sinduriensis BLB-1 = JCM 15800]
MNWFKKQINKLFDNDIDDEEYYEEDEFEELTSTSLDEAGRHTDNQNKKKSFKFPIIADEEIEPPLQSTQSLDQEFQNELSNRLDESKRESKYFYQQNAISKVFDVEVSGIRDLLEKRQRIKGYSNVMNHQESTKIRRVEKAKNLEPIKKEIKNPLPVKKNVVEQDDPLIPKRRFVPTQVPSPVYGFKKPSNIDQLLSKKQGRAGTKQNANENEPEDSLSIPDVAPIQFEKKVELMLSESARVKEEIASSLSPLATTESLQPEDEADVHMATANRYIEIEDEVNEEPYSLGTELFAQVEELPILAETSVLESLEADNESGWSELEERVSNNFDSMNQHAVPQLVENGLVEQLIKEVEIEVEMNDEDAWASEEIEAANANDIHNYEEPKGIYPETEIVHQSYTEEQPIQSAQVSRLVSIALGDADFEVETVSHTEVEHESLSSNEQHFERQAIDVSDTGEINIDGINNLCGNEESITEQPPSKGSRLPFNVLMLKSDKEKYAAKLAQKQMAQHNDVIKEMHRHTTKTEEQRETEQSHSALLSVSTEEVPDTVEKYQQPIVLQVDDTEKNEMLQMDEGETELFSEEVEPTPKMEISPNQKDKSSPKIYIKPSYDFLSPPEEKTEDREWLESQGEVLVESLSYFQVTAQVESITQGPAVTQFEITVGHGTKVSKVRNLSDDLKLALAAKDIRIQAPIPGKSTIGIEIPNRISRAVQLSEVTCSDSFLQSESPLEAALGLDLTGKPVTIDLRKMPHGLIAGATGSGKSVCINSILVSLLYKADPNELKLMLIDPKMVELAPFNHIPHLVSPVITDVKAATAALKWAVEEMERRYQLFAHVGVRDLPRYNKLADSKGEHGHKLPYILIVIDELADLMMMSPADVEEAICRIAQKARACGIHLIVATQRPSVDVITGLIKSNIPTRIAFAVSSQVDSRTILDSQGAERLLGRGDMLYLGNGMSAPIRLQGTFVTDDEIEEIIDHVRGQGEPDYFFQQDELLKKSEMVEEQDELFEEVCRFVHEQGSASTSSIQRKYHIGYNRAARLIDMLESQGFISEPRGSKPREVYITDSDLTSMFE